MVASLRDIAHRGDRVYLNIDRELANIWAVPYTNDAGGGGYGWLYRVRVDVDALEPVADRLPEQLALPQAEPRAGPVVSSARGLAR